MSDREEFEEFAKDRGLSIGKLPHGDYRLFSTGEAYAAWQAAHAQSRQGAEPVGYLHNRPERIPCFFETLDDARLSGCEVVPVYTHPQPAQEGSVPSRDDLVQCLLATRGQSEGVAADAILWLLTATTPQQEGDAVAVPVAALEYLKDQWPGAYAKLYERICSNKRPQPPKEDA